MINFEQWEGFEGRIWKEEVNNRHNGGLYPGPDKNAAEKAVEKSM